MRREYDGYIKSYEKNDKNLNEEKGSIEKNIQELSKNIIAQTNIISENQKRVTNIEEVRENINKHLLDFGISDFQIVPHGEREYRIKRNHEEEGREIFQSLSEGEKTVISFLYFIELCKGKETEADKKQKIVVIDDPISSLSHMYVFNVAQLIKKYFTNTKSAFLQCLVLTHSLYFFNELIYRKDDERNMHQKLFRISKKNYSNIQDMKYNEIQNDYQAYWCIIKDGKHENMVLIANAMRNIIEYFFGFIDGSDSLNNIFQKSELSDNKYQSFRRYIDRESHSDAINLSDYREFDYDIFMEVFELVFRKTGYENHYKKMMHK